MILPDVDRDGWSLEDGEEYHRRAPDTFHIPDRELREIMPPGAFVKLIFRIAVDDDEEPVVYERMWVIVRERIEGGYLGILDNNPFAISENDEFWSGIELPFEPRHIIEAQVPNAASLAIAEAIPKRRWTYLEQPDPSTAPPPVDQCS
jgi:hypothetical protein